MTRKCIFINGPPGSGKDTVAEILAANHDYHPMKFATALKTGLACLLGLEDDEYFAYFESHLKEENVGPFKTITPRQALIDLSEEFMKPRFGREIFGRVAANIARDMDCDVVFSDCGFDTEVIPVVSDFMPKNCQVIQLAREGCSFEGDSRKYLKQFLFPGVKFRWVINNVSIPELEELIAEIV